MFFKFKKFYQLQTEQGEFYYMVVTLGIGKALEVICICVERQRISDKRMISRAIGTSSK